MLPNGLGVALAAVGPPLADQVWQDVTAGAPVGDWLSRALTAARARVVSPSEPCVRIGGPSDGQAAEARLYAALGSQIDTRLDRLVHRRLSRPITWRAVRWGLKPNHLTLASLGLGLGAAWCVGFAGALGMLAGIVLYAGSVILDHADGDLARLTLAESRVGEWLDVAVDTVVHALLVVAMGASAESAGARVGLTAGSIGALGVVASAGVAKTWPPSGRRGVGAVLQGLSNRNAFYGLLLVFGLGQVFLPVSLPLIIALAAAGMHAYWLGAVAHRLLARGREDAEARPRPGAPGAR
jgi:phosphatidylglycerophosphate synthase